MPINSYEDAASRLQMVSNGICSATYAAGPDQSLPNISLTVARVFTTFFLEYDRTVEEAYLGTADYAEGERERAGCCALSELGGFFETRLPGPALADSLRARLSYCGFQL